MDSPDAIQSQGEILIPPPLVIEEYKALRDEILKRLDVRYQLVNLTLVIIATLFSAGLQPNVAPSVLLLYPIVGMFLSAGWVQNNYTLYELADYIRQNIENKYGGAGWQGYVANPPKRHRKGITYFFSSLFFFSVAVFCGTQVIAMLLGIARIRGTTPAMEEWILLVIDGIAVLLTAFMFIRERRFRHQFIYDHSSSM